jgi:hypothetical protein
MGLLHDRKSLPELERDGMGETILMIFLFLLGILFYIAWMMTRIIG